MAEFIRPNLDAGRVIVSDRFLLANVVYQGYAGGLDVDEIWRIGQVATAGIRPDLTFVLDMPPESAFGRIARPLDRMELQTQEFQHRLRQGYVTEAAARPNEIVLIDASRSVDVVQAEIRNHAARILGG